MAGRILDGLPRDEVERLLGPSDASGEKQIVYELSPQRGVMRIDSEQLVISLARSGQVDRYDLTTD